MILYWFTLMFKMMWIKQLKHSFTFKLFYTLIVCRRGALKPEKNTHLLLNKSPNWAATQTNPPVSIYRPSNTTNRPEPECWWTFSSTCLQQHTVQKHQPAKTNRFIRKVSCKHGETTKPEPQFTSLSGQSAAVLKKSVTAENADHQTHKRSCFRSFFVCLFVFTSDSTATTSAEATERRAGKRAFMDAAHPCRQLGHTGRWSPAAAAAAANQYTREAETRPGRAESSRAEQTTERWPIRFWPAATSALPPAFNLLVASFAVWQHWWETFKKEKVSREGVMRLQKKKRWQTQKKVKNVVLKVDLLLLLKRCFSDI